MRARKTTGLCFECCKPVTGMKKYCDKCLAERCNASRRGDYFFSVESSIEEARNLDAPLRLDRVIDLAIRCAY